MTLDISVTDMFCGAGGSTTGAVRAGAQVTLALNHWSLAIETHNTNYPGTTHVLTDISRADPRRYPRTTILVASPECTNHSIAKGRRRRGQAQMPLPGFGERGYDPAEERSRCTMWDPLRWAECHHYELVILENVVDARLWVMWDAWLHAWQNLGYDWEIVYLNSMFAHPTPQSRDRLYFVAWKRGNRKPDLRIEPLAFCPKCGRDVKAHQSWKNPTRRYGKYRQQYVYRCPSCASEVTPYYYAAANAIDWSIPTPRIGDRKRPLRAKTMRRIASGLEKFVQQPFTVQVNKTSDRVRSALSDPFPTQTADNGLALVWPFVAERHGTSTTGSAAEALATVCAGGQHRGLVVPLPFVLDQTGEYRLRDLRAPLSTVVGAGNHHGLVLPPAWLLTYYNHGKLANVTEAAPTVTTLERHALVTAGGQGAALPVRIEECGFRMLSWEEIRAAMAFPATYILLGTRREIIRLLGNAVTPPVMELLMRRCLASLG